MTSSPNKEDPRWQYRILWRYGALLLVAIGLAAMSFGAAGLVTTAAAVTLLPVGFVSLVTRVVLPRIEGRFSAGPSGLSAEILPVHQLDRPRYVVSGPVLETEPIADAEAPTGEAREQPTQPITIGDVWDALEEAGLRPDGVATGHAYFSLRKGRLLEVPNRGMMDSATASDDLLAVLKTWDIRPAASGKYTARSDIEDRHWGTLQNVPGQMLEQP